MYPLRVLTVFWSKLGCVASAYSFIAVSSVSFCTLRSLWTLLIYWLIFAGRNLKATIIWTSSSSVSAGIVLLHPCVAIVHCPGIFFFFSGMFVVDWNLTKHTTTKALFIYKKKKYKFKYYWCFLNEWTAIQQKKKKKVGIHFFFFRFSLFNQVLNY